MSMFGRFRLVPSNTVVELLENPEDILDFLFENEAEDPEDSFDVDRALRGKRVGVDRVPRLNSPSRTFMSHL